MKPLSSKGSKGAELPGLKVNKSVAVIDAKKIAPENEKWLNPIQNPAIAAPKELKPIKNQSMIKGSMTAWGKPSAKEKSVKKAGKGLNKSAVSNKSSKSVKSTKEKAPAASSKTLKSSVKSKSPGRKSWGKSRE